ncbi:MAG: hypothetical protein ACK40H_04020, partial [Sphingomonadaceae bacterium]
PTDAEMSDYINNTMGPDTYRQFLQLYSERSVRQLVEVTLVNRKYEQFLRDKIRRERSIRVTEQEARDYFLKNIELYHLPEGCYLSIISVDSKAKADQVLARLHDLTPQLATLAPNSVEAAEARRIIGESLRRLVDSWAAVPPAARAQDPGVDRALETGLAALAAALADLSQRLASGRVKDLAVESRYLESRYREGGPGA